MRTGGILCIALICIALSRAQNNGTQSSQEQKDVQFEIPGKKILDFFKWALSSFRDDNSFMGRCIGMARRLKFVMPFLLFKLGVIVTVLGFLTLFSMKGLGIGLLLLMINAGGFFGKLALLKSGHDHGPKEYFIPQPAPAVHLHVHKDAAVSHGHEHSYGHYETGPTAWSDRVSQGLSFNVNSALGRTEGIKKYLSNYQS